MKTDRLHRTGAALALVACCAVGRAQEPVQTFVWGARAEATRPPLTLSFELDGERVEIRVDGGQVTASVGGEPLGRDRLRTVTGPLSIADATELRDQHGARVAWLRTDPQGLTVQFEHRSRSAWLGVDVQPVDEALADHLGIDPGEGCVIVALPDDSPAAVAGLRKHDVLVALDGERPLGDARLREILGDRQPGDRVVLTVMRRGETLEIPVELGRAPGASGLPGYPRLGAAGWLLGRPDDSTYWLWPQLRDAADTGRYAQWLLATQGWRVGHQGEPAPVDPAPVPEPAIVEGGPGDLDARLTRIEVQLEALEKLLEKLDRRRDS
ncbi:MAG: PDZ domain-containing protein [Planctomycetes bacterium]|nr:PDZ domain-containing protein [Planctomycetota bacterium]